MSGSLFPGAPTLLNPLLGTVGSLPLLEVADAVGLNSETSLGQWGIYDQKTGQSVVTFDSAVSFNFVVEDEISDYTVEGGGFQTYNKVSRPFIIKMTVALGAGSLLNSVVSAVQSGSLGGVVGAFNGTTRRATFLNQIAAAELSIALLNIVTPDITYPSVNIIHHDYDRSAQQGAKLLQVSIWFEQVKDTASASFSNTASPTSAAQSNNGPVSAADPTPAQTSVVTSTGTS